MLPGLPRRASGTPKAAACDIIVPVFNRPDCVRDLLRSLAAHTDRSRLGHIWIGDDGSDSFTRSQLPLLIKESGLPVTLVSRPQNLGFALNCNELFSRCQSPYVVVLNSDVAVPPFWLERMLAPFAADPAVALATPYATDAANHTLRLQPGQHWQEADRLLASRPPAFPDDCTAIGFCMAVDRLKIQESGMVLFDPAFGRGYGEDTDLHYRVLEQGFRSVIVDNLLVFHAGGSSFAALPDGRAIRDKGQALFWERWADRHARGHAAFEQKGALASVMDPATHVCRFRAPQRKLDVLFVLPSSFLRYGGVWFVANMIAHLSERGFSAAAFVWRQENLYSDFAPYGFRAYDDPGDLRASVTEIGCVIATSDITIPTARAFSEQYRCPEILLLQCMEVCFRSGISVDTYLQYGRIPKVIAVSDALRDYIRIIQPQVDAKALSIGPDPLVFYPRDTVRIPKSVAIAVNGIPEKAYTHALEIGLMLRDRGFSLMFFGWDTALYPVPESIGKTFAATDRTAVADLLSRTEFLIDHSYLEGLGLVPLEAAFSGCVPIIASKGAPEYIFQDGRDCIRLTGYKGLAAALQRIVSLTPAAIASLRRNCLKLRDRFTLQQGLVQFEQAVAGWTGMEREVPPDWASYPLRPR